MFEAPFADADRTELKVNSRLDFFRGALPILPDFENDEFAEICQRLSELDPELFEIPIYGPDSDPEDDPVAVVVFVDDKVYLDCLEQSLKPKLIQILKAMTDMKIGKSRLLTRRDWVIRLQGLAQEELIEELEDHK